MRATLSPAFTSSKMKGMFQFVTECGEDLMSHFDEELKKSQSQGDYHMFIPSPGLSETLEHGTLQIL